MRARISTRTPSAEVPGEEMTTRPCLRATPPAACRPGLMVVGMGHAAIAATAVHNRLPTNWRERQA